MQTTTQNNVNAIPEAPSFTHKDWHATMAKSKHAPPLKTLTIDVPDLFVRKYLMTDGIIKPEMILNQQYVDDSDSDNNSSSSSDSESDNKDKIVEESKVAEGPQVQEATDPEQAEFLQICASLREKIDKIVNVDSEEFGKNGAFIKLDNIAASDAKWMNHDLCCHNTDDVFYILKASKRIGKYLISNQVKNDQQSTDIQSNPKKQLMLKKYYELNKCMEFRVFVKENKVVGISQRDYTVQYDFLSAKDKAIMDFKDEKGNKSKLSINEIVIKQVYLAKQEIDTLFSQTQETGGPCGQTSYIFDIYLSKEPTFKVKLLDMSPWNTSSSLLFSWYDLNKIDIENPEFEAEFRVTTTKNGTFVNDVLEDEDLMIEDLSNLKEFQEFMKSNQGNQNT